MHQNTPPTPPPAPMPNGNPYDFILNQGQKPKRSLGGSSKQVRIIMVAVGFFALLVGILVVFSIISSAGKGSTDNLVKLAQQQTEIARVAAIGVEKGGSSDTKNLAITTQLSLKTSAANTIALLSKQGHKVKEQTLALAQNSQTDTQLDSAAASNTFDETFTKLIKAQLASYRTTLQNDFNATSKTSERQLLQDSFNSVVIILNEQKT